MIIDLINYIYLYVILDNFTPFKDVNMNLYSKNLYKWSGGVLGL